MDTQSRTWNAGKEKCRALRQIRQKIAEANGIPFQTEECNVDGPCRGTCPKCDEEISYLEQALRARQDRGEGVVLSGLGKNELEAYSEAVRLSSTGDAMSARSSSGGPDVLGMIQDPWRDQGPETAGVPADPDWQRRQEEAARRKSSRNLRIGAAVFLIIIFIFFFFILYRNTHGDSFGPENRISAADEGWHGVSNCGY